MAQSTWNSLSKHSNTTLTAYGDSKITPVGQVSVTAKISNRAVDTEFFVIEQEAPMLLGVHSTEHFAKNRFSIRVKEFYKHTR